MQGQHERGLKNLRLLLLCLFIATLASGVHAEASDEKPMCGASLQQYQLPCYSTLVSFNISAPPPLPRSTHVRPLLVCLSSVELGVSRPLTCGLGNPVCVTAVLDHVMNPLNPGGKKHSGPCGGRDCSGGCKCFPEKGARETQRRERKSHIPHLKDAKESPGDVRFPEWVELILPSCPDWLRPDTAYRESTQRFGELTLQPHHPLPWQRAHSSPPQGIQLRTLFILQAEPLKPLTPLGELSPISPPVHKAEGDVDLQEMSQEKCIQEKHRAIPKPSTPGDSLGPDE
ncbi:hypothetical protein KUCAC02_010388, partial [Chaenocephalus aceratus]